VLGGLRLSSKFIIGIGVILFVFWCAFAAFLYTYLRNDLVTHSYEKSDILFGHITATSHYVQERLRPRMFELLPEEVILKEAMSTTFINKSIMESFNEEFPQYSFRRVALAPLNPENLADEFEASFIRRLNESGETHWKGTVKRNGSRYFINMRAVPAEEECFRCHTDAAEKELLGVEYVSIPVDDALKAMTQITMSIFFMGITGMAFLFTIINLYIEGTIARPIKKVGSFFKAVVEGQRGLYLERRSRDEVGEMLESFNRMMAHLKESEDKLTASEKKYRHLFQNTKDAIIMTDREGRFIDVNPAARELFPEGAENVSALFTLPVDHEHTVREMESRGFVKDFETTLRGPDGKTLHALLTASRRLDESGLILGREYVIKDITERKWMEEKMRNAERLAAVGTLAAGVAHEINNPLSVILGYTRLLLREPLAESVRGDLATIVRNAESCKKIVEDLLHFSRLSRPSLAVADLNSLLEDVLSDLTNAFSKSGITVEKIMERSMPGVFIDAGRIRQVLMNVLVNASQAMPQGGTVAVMTEFDAGGGKARVSISDSGTGIKEEHLARIFDPFFTTKEGGSGLGLSVSYGIIKEHGGEILVSRNSGRGTTFTIVLPAKDGAPSERKSSS